MAFRFINYILDDFNAEQINTENRNSIWNGVEIRQIQNLNHSRIPNINQQENFQPTHFNYWSPNKQLQSYVAISRAKTWDSVNIIALDRELIHK